MWTWSPVWLYLDQNKDESRLQGYRNAIQHFWALRISWDGHSVNERSKSSLLKPEIEIFKCWFLLISSHWLLLWNTSHVINYPFHWGQHSGTNTCIWHIQGLLFNVTLVLFFCGQFIMLLNKYLKICKTDSCRRWCMFWLKIEWCHFKI